MCRRQCDRAHSIIRMPLWRWGSHWGQCSGDLWIPYGGILWTLFLGVDAGILILCIYEYMRMSVCLPIFTDLVCCLVSTDLMSGWVSGWENDIGHQVHDHVLRLVMDMSVSIHESQIFCLSIRHDSMNLVSDSIHTDQARILWLPVTNTGIYGYSQSCPFCMNDPMYSVRRRDNGHDAPIEWALVTTEVINSTIQVSWAMMCLQTIESSRKREKHGEWWRMKDERKNKIAFLDMPCVRHESLGPSQSSLSVF